MTRNEDSNTISKDVPRSAIKLTALPRRSSVGSSTDPRTQKPHRLPPATTAKPAKPVGESETGGLRRRAPLGKATELPGGAEEQVHHVRRPQLVVRHVHSTEVDVESDNDTETLFFWRRVDGEDEDDGASGQPRRVSTLAARAMAGLGLGGGGGDDGDGDDAAGICFTGDDAVAVTADSESDGHSQGGVAPTGDRIAAGDGGATTAGVPSQSDGDEDYEDTYDDDDGNVDADAT